MRALLERFRKAKLVGPWWEMTFTETPPGLNQPTATAAASGVAGPRPFLLPRPFQAQVILP
jgi:hypothetical protein